MCPAPDRARRKTGDYTEINMGGTSAKTADGDSPDADGDKLTANEMTTIVVPGTERATLVTWDITNYLNDTNFNENAQVMYQYDQDGKEKASYTYGEADQRISGDLSKEAVKYTEQKAGDYTYLYDGQGNVAETIRKGAVAESYSYDPFGEMTAEGKEGTSKTPLEAQNDNGLSDNDVLWGYNGEEYIEEVGLQYLRQRHYNPETGTFTSQDTNAGDLTNPLSQNRYIYAENDPVNGNDPGGDKKKAKKTSTKKTNKKTTKSSSKSSKKTTAKKNTKKTTKKSSSKKKFSSKKSSSKKSGSLWNRLKAKAKKEVARAKKGIKKQIRNARDKARDLKKSVTCLAKQGKSIVTKKIQNAKVKITKAKHMLKTKATNALASAKRNLPKIIKSLPAMGGLTSIIAVKKEVNSLKDKFYKWADTIRTGFEPNTSMKLQMEQNYTAYLQNNSSYKSSKEYQDAFRNKTLRDDLEIAESQINALLFVLGEGLGGTGTQSSYIKSGATSRTSSIKSVSERKTTLDFLKNIRKKKGKFYADKATLDEIGKIEARGEDFSLLKKEKMNSRPSSEGGVSAVYRYKDEMGTKYIIHEVTDANGKIIHRDFDTVRIASGQWINKGGK